MTPLFTYGDKMTTGIYLLRFIGTDKVYIGRGTSIEQRMYSHIAKFKQGTHTKKMMQAYREFGMPSIETLIECNIEELAELENEAIEIFNSVDNGFNTLYRSEDTHYGSTCQGEKHGMSKYSNDTIEKAFNLIVSDVYMSTADIIKKTGVSAAVVAHISSGKRYSWLKEKYPEKYSLLRSIADIRNSISKRTEESPLGRVKVISPEGVVYTVHHLRNFCKEHDLDHSNFGKLIRGKRIQHKNWKVYK